MAKFGQWIRDRSAKSKSLTPKMDEKTPPARRASSTPPAGGFQPRQTPVAKPFPMMQRMDTGATARPQPAAGPTHSVTQSAEPGRRGSQPLASPRPAASTRQASQRAAAKRTVGPTPPRAPVQAGPPARPGPKRSSRKRRPREPQRAGGEVVPQIALAMKSRGTESERPPSLTLDDLPDLSFNKLSIQELRRAIVLREVLDPPLAIRKPDSAPW